MSFARPFARPTAPPPSLPRGLDLFSSFGAGVLARFIEAHWKARGFAGIKAKRYELHGMSQVFGVSSNIGPNGYPPRSAREGGA